MYKDFVAKNVACCAPRSMSADRKMENCGLGHGKVWPQHKAIIDYKTWPSQLAPSNESLLYQLTHTLTHRNTARTHKPWPGQAISAVAITHDRRQETGNIAATSLSNFKRCTLFATCNICAAKFFRFSAADNKTVHCSRWGKVTSEKPEAAATAAARIHCACVCCDLPPTCLLFCRQFFLRVFDYSCQKTQLIRC